ncbi:MAG: flagellar basal body P-ring formation chaperone FlgA [Parvularculaceae bacterium]|nr:flagellar basal body P-ring formation chaperone FlgA [Parvularculaceae bacterium]
MNRAAWLVLLLAMLAAPILADDARAADAPAPTRLADHADDIRAALIQEGAPVDVKVSLSAPEAQINAGPDGLVIETVSFNRSSGRFLIRARGGAGEPLIAISGVAAVPVVLPVPAREIPRGDIITEDDIDFIESVDGANRAFLKDADLVIGKAARRALQKGAPLRAGDLNSPLLVKRGATVTIVLEAPGLRLTQLASALESGAEGDLIAFRNLTSGAELKAFVVTPALAAAPMRAGPGRHAALTMEP